MNPLDLLAALLGEIARITKDVYVAGYQPVAAGSARTRQVRLALRDNGRGNVIGGTRAVLR